MPKRTYEDLKTVNKITEILKYEIEHCGKMKKDIAKEIGITRSALSDYLSGRTLPNLTVFKKLCESIEVSADTLLNIQLK